MLLIILINKILTIQQFFEVTKLKRFHKTNKYENLMCNYLCVITYDTFLS